VGKRRGRRWITGIFAFFILLMNAFPVIALAEGATLQPPTMQVPDYQTPDLQAPEWEVPQLEGVQWDMPQLEPPPGIVPEWDTPQLQAPDGNTPQLQPGGNVPQLQAPDGQAPDLSAPNGSRPDLQAPGGSGPATGINGGGVPQLTPPGLDPNTKRPEPFGETLGYKALELSFKDVIGDTLSYSADLLEQGQVSAGAGAGGYAKVLLTLGLKGMDISLQGSDYQNYTSGALDLMGAKGAYDNYKFVLQQKANAVANAANAQRSITNGAQAANNVVRVPGLVTGLNVGVAAISLPFDAFNTYTAFSQIEDPSLSPEQQGEKFLDGVSNLGSTLMDAGVIASVIPGGQTAGVVLVTVGGVLWVGSKAIKWLDKLAGGKMGKWLKEKTMAGIDWAKEKAGDAIGWVKSIFS